MNWINEVLNWLSNPSWWFYLLVSVPLMALGAAKLYLMARETKKDPHPGG